MIPIVIDAFGTIPKGLVKRDMEKLEIKNRIEAIQTTDLLRSAGIMRRLQKAAGIFKRQTNEISHEKTVKLVKKENLKSESFQIAAENNKNQLCPSKNR